MPSRDCVGWSKEFVCDRLHLSFGQSQAVSAVHRQLNCSDYVTLDHGFELHDHIPPLKHTIGNMCHQQCGQTYDVQRLCRSKVATGCMQSSMIKSGLRIDVACAFQYVL